MALSFIKANQKAQPETSKPAGKLYTFFRWYILPLAGSLLLGILLWSLVISLIYYSVISYDNRREKEALCGSALESNAQNLAATIADYYASPDNQDLPTLKILKEDYNLSFFEGPYKHKYLIEKIPEKSGEDFTIKITVFPDEECSSIDSNRNRYVKYLGSWPEETDGFPVDVDGWN